MLDSTDLSGMRDALEQLMPDTCTILSQTNTSDGQGGWVTTWGTVAVNVKCRIDPGRKEMYERVNGATLQPYSWWWLTLPWNQAIDETYRVVVNGDTYNVVNHDDNKSWQATTRAVVQKV